MSKYTLVKLDDVPDSLGDYPGEMKFLKKHLETEQVALSFRRMPAKTGAKGSYGHRHKTQEEVIFVLSGKLQVKVDDEIVEVGPKTVIRIPPGVVQGSWNDGPEDVELLIISTRSPDLRKEVEFVQDFWPE